MKKKSYLCMLASTGCEMVKRYEISITNIFIKI